MDELRRSRSGNGWPKWLKATIGAIFAALLSGAVGWASWVSINNGKCAEAQEDAREAKEGVGELRQVIATHFQDPEIHWTALTRLNERVEAQSNLITAKLSDIQRRLDRIETKLDMPR